MSTKPIRELLQVKPGRALAALHVPASVKSVLAPYGNDPERGDVVLLFAPDRAALEAGLPPLLPHLKPAAIFWLAYPKLTSPLARDLNRDLIREAAPSYGLETVSQIAIDADWSALRLKRVTTG